jgi:hypothetical protein
MHQQMFRKVPQRTDEDWAAVPGANGGDAEWWAIVSGPTPLWSSAQP